MRDPLRTVITDWTAWGVAMVVGIVLIPIGLVATVFWRFRKPPDGP